MGAERKIAAIVLAAGRSSRMGASKPLLPLGAQSVIERVVGCVAAAGVDDVVVVTGHEADEVVPLLARLPTRMVHNAGYDDGMFSSVRTGARALPKDVEAFFVLPVDYPLVRPQVLDCLIDHFRGSRRGPVHPTCCGLRGHPPLLPGGCREELLRADNTDTLHGLLERHREEESEVELEDPTVLLDMDTVADYEMIRRFAGFLDAPTEPSVPTVDEALYLLSILETPDRVVRHCKAVAAVGEALAKALEPHIPRLRADLIRAGCLLHDIARVRPKHAVAGRNVLANLGLGRLAAIVGAHMVLSPEQLDTPLLTEEQLVYLADKLVVDDTVSRLEERKARVLRSHADDPAAREGAKTRITAAQTIAARAESILGRRLEEVLPRNARPSI